MEIQGLISLTFLTLLIVCVPFIVKSFWQKSIIDSSNDQAVLRSWYEDTNVKVSPIRVEKPTRVRHFDPNKLTRSEWKDLGFTDAVANNILKYRSTGARFNTKEDLLKIYGINQRLVKDYMPYIVIAKPYVPRVSAAASVPVYKPKPKKEFVKIDLNTADSIGFQTINGIGKYWSSRIVKYRDQLGGFVEQDQIYEIYGMKQELADWVLDHAVFARGNIKQLTINQDSIKVLAAHPYISYSTARSIVNYRNQHGDYSQVQDLKKIVTISDSLYQKVSPYLKVSE